jgi:hypothetical protein
MRLTLVAMSYEKTPFQDIPDRTCEARCHVNMPSNLPMPSYKRGMPSYSEYPSARFMFSGGIFVSTSNVVLILLVGEKRGEKSLTETLRGSTLVEVIYRGAAFMIVSICNSLFNNVHRNDSHNHTLAGTVHGEPAKLAMMLLSDIAHNGGLAHHFHELLASIAVLEELAHITLGHLLFERNRHSEMDTLEPDCDVRHERDRDAEMVSNLLFVNVARQTVGDQVVSEVVDVVLGAWLGSSTGIATDTKDGGVAVQIVNKRRNGQLSSRRVAAGVADPGRLANLGALGELWQTIRPRVGEAIVGGEINNDALVITLVLDLIESVDVGLAHGIGQSHDPAVDLLILVQLSNILRRQRLVDDLALGVALELLATELSRRHVAEVHHGMVIQEVNQSLAGISSSTDQTNAGRDRV